MVEVTGGPTVAVEIPTTDRDLGRIEPVLIRSDFPRSRQIEI